MIIKNHTIVLKDTSPSEMARFRQIMLNIWRQQIEDDKNAAEMEKFYKNFPYVWDNENSGTFEDPNGISLGNDYQIDLDGNVTLKQKTKNNFDRLYKGDMFIGITNKGTLGQLVGKNIVESDFNEIKFNNRPDLNSFLNLTIKIQYAYDREVSALMVGKRTGNLDDLRTKTYDLLLVGLKHSSGKSYDDKGNFDGYSNFLPELMKNLGFNETSTCLNFKEKYYDVAGFYHTHPVAGPKPSGNINEQGKPVGDLHIYHKYNLPGYIKTDMGWSIVSPDGTGKVQFDEESNSKIMFFVNGKIYDSKPILNNEKNLNN